MKRFVSASLLCLSLIGAPALAAESVSVETLAGQISSGKAPLIIDVRGEDEFLAGRIPGARLIPHTEMGNYVDSLSAYKDEPILLYCRSGKRSGEAAAVLEKAGFSKVQVLDGSFPGWEAAGHKVQK
jgi:rhodanese-related sulfurtransferase